jgi:transketolase
MKLGTARVLSDGSDFTVLSAGICTEEVIKVSQLLEELGISIRHLHISTHKPFDDPAVYEALAAARLGVITMENHTVIGGLGSAVAELMAEAGMPQKLIRLGIQDQYAHGASRPYLAKKYELDAMSLVSAAEQLIGESLGIDEGDIQTTPIIAADTLAKAEDL